jgi:hypothetical protein
MLLNFHIRCEYRAVLFPTVIDKEDDLVNPNICDNPKFAQDGRNALHQSGQAVQIKAGAECQGIGSSIRASHAPGQMTHKLLTMPVNSDFEQRLTGSRLGR